MRIVNPSFGLEAASDPATSSWVSAGEVDWLQDPIVMFSNSKPNTRELLEGLKQHMGGFRNIENIGFAYKDGAGQPAPEAVIDHVAENYRGAILATAD